MGEYKKYYDGLNKYNSYMLKKHNVKIIEEDVNNIKYTHKPTQFIRKLNNMIRNNLDKEKKVLFIDPNKIIFPELDKYFYNKYKVGKVIAEELIKLATNDSEKEMINGICKSIIDRLE